MALDSHRHRQSLAERGKSGCLAVQPANSLQIDAIEGS